MEPIYKFSSVTALQTAITKFNNCVGQLEKLIPKLHETIVGKRVISTGLDKKTSATAENILRHYTEYFHTLYISASRGYKTPDCVEYVDGLTLQWTVLYYHGSDRDTNAFYSTSHQLVDTDNGKFILPKDPQQAPKKLDIGTMLTARKNIAEIDKQLHQLKTQRELVKSQLYPLIEV